MANATARVARAHRSYPNENIAHSWDTLAAQVQLYNSAMVGVKTNGYLAKFDDTQSLRFFGIILDDPSLSGGQGPKLPNNGATTGTAGDGTLDVDVKQPPAFEINITAVAITDIGRRVYALDDQTGTLDPSATTYANVIGTVRDLVYAMNGGSPVANYALVKPIYDQPNGNQLQMLASSGAVVIKPSTVIITKAGVAALTIADPTTGVHDGLEMTFISATAQAHTLDNSAGSGFNAGGGSADVGTFGGAKGDGLTIVAYGGDWFVKSKTNVTLA